MIDRSANRLTPLWRTLFAFAWIAGFFAYAAIWQASTQLGIGTWWIGPRAQPTSSLVRLLPSGITLGMVVLTAYGIRRLPTIGLGASALLLIGAIPDVSRSTSLALTEVVVALALMATSAAAFTGLTGRRRPMPDVEASAGATWAPPEREGDPPTDSGAAASMGEPSGADR